MNIILLWATKRARLLFLHEVERGSLPDRPILDLVVEVLEQLDAGQRAAERSLKHLKTIKMIVKNHQHINFRPHNRFVCPLKQNAALIYFAFGQEWLAKPSQVPQALADGQ